MIPIVTVRHSGMKNSFRGKDVLFISGKNDHQHNVLCMIQANLLHPSLQSFFVTLNTCKGLLLCFHHNKYIAGSAQYCRISKNLKIGFYCFPLILRIKSSL